MKVVVSMKRCTWLEEAPCFVMWGLALNSDGQVYRNSFPFSLSDNGTLSILYIVLRLMPIKTLWKGQ